jgi:hypothetical protein
MRSFGSNFSCLAVVMILCLATSGCGGGSSGSGGGGSNTSITAVSVSCSPSSIQVNQASKCSSTVTGTGSFSSSVTWSVNQGTIDQSGNYTAPANVTTATVTATSTQDSTKSGTASVTVTPATPATIGLSSLAFAPSSVVSGNGSTGTVVAVGPAPTGGVVISLSSGNSAVVSVPSSVTIPAGSTSATFSVSSGSVATATGVSITASSATVVSSVVTVDPAATVNWSGGPSPSFPITGQCFAGDFNGDGKTDLACYLGNGASGPNAGVWSVALSTGSGWQLESWSGGQGPALPVTGQCVTGDFNGDGKTDIACFTGFAGEVWSVSLSTGSGWETQSWSGGPLLAAEWNVVPIPGQCFAADFNGDGKTDLACSDGVDDVWSVALSTGSGWNTAPWSGGPTVPLPMTQQCLDGDLNGDGKADLFCWTGEGGGWGVALSTGSGFQSSIWSGGPAPLDEWNVIPVGGQCFTGDFNGDGKTDVTCPATVTSCGDPYGCTNGDWSMSLSTGSGWNGESWTTGGPGVAMPVSDQCVIGDFNGDGKTDIACWSGFAGGVWGVSLSTGSSWNGSIWNGGPEPIQEWNVIPVGGQCFTGDFNGGGKTDVACYSGGGVWQVALSTGSGW